MLPFNTRHLGASEYGLWMLATSIVAYFPVLELGYGAAMERFVAHNRALRNGNGDQRDRQHAGVRLRRHRPRGAGGAHDHRLSPRCDVRLEPGAGAHRRLRAAAGESAVHARPAVRDLWRARQRISTHVSEQRRRHHRGDHRRRGERRGSHGGRWARRAGRRDDGGAGAQLRRLSQQCLSGLSTAAYPPVPVPHAPAARGDRLQRLHVAQRRREQAELRDRSHRHCRGPEHGSRRDLDGGAAARPTSFTG